MTRSNDRVEQFERLFDEALAARNDGDLEMAVRTCLGALEILGSSHRTLQAMVYGELGYVYKLLCNEESSLECYRRAVALSPRSELPSLGLFHALARQGHWLHALAEAVRYLHLRDSDEYRELFCDGFGDGLDSNVRELIVQARELLRRHASAS